MRPRQNTPPTSPPSRPRIRHAALLAALITLTLLAAVAAKPPGEDTTNDTSPRTVALSGGPIQLAARLDRGSVLRGGDGSLRVELVISAQAQGSDVSQRVPTDLVVVLDRSGSMQGQPLSFARAAVRQLIDQLAPEDRFALVTYATGGETPIALAAASPEARRHWRTRIDEVVASGGTNMSRGLDLAHAIVSSSKYVGRAPRVLLISDGHANQGDHSLAGLRKRAGRSVVGEYVLSSVGVGSGFDETVMSAVADAGTGNFYYLPDLTALSDVFSAEFASARETVAAALEVSFEPAAGVVMESASGYPLERAGETVRFRPGNLAAGQERRIWITLRAPTGDPGEIELGVLSLAFSSGDGERHRIDLPALPKLACVAGEDDYYASFDAEVYRRGSRSEALGRLKEKVAAKLRAGDQAQAVSEVDAYLTRLETEQLRAFGYVDAEAIAPAEALRDTVAAPAAASAPVQNLLGKQYLEEGRDLQRAGSKR